jgi:plastocyanin
MKMKHLVFMLSLAAIAFFSNSCSKSNNKAAAPPASNGNSVIITGMSFPSNTTVAKGTTVVWNNKDAIAHTVTSDDGTTFSSGSLDPGSTFSYVANTAGSFPYHCNFHSNMKGTLTVTP